MTNLQRRRQRRFITPPHRIMTRSRPLFELLEDRRVLAAIAWDGGGDGSSWQDSRNWNTDTIPGAADDVTIDVPGSPTIEIFSSAGSPVVNSIQSEELISLRTTLTVNTDSSFSGGISVSFGQLMGDGNISVGGSSFMGAATVGGTGKLIVQPNSTLRMSSQSNTALNRVTEVFGTVAVGNTRRSPLALGGSGERLLIHPEGTLHLVEAARISGSRDAVIRNQGTLLVTGEQDAEVVLELQSEGAFDLQGGELRLRGGGAATHSVDVSADATLEMSDFQFGPGTTLSGAGRIEFIGGTQDFTEAMLLPEGTVTFVGSTTTIGNTFPDVAQIEQIRGTVTFNADQILHAVDADFGAISGSGNLTFTGVSRLNQSRLTGTGQVTVASDATLNIFGSGATITSVLENHGEIRQFGRLSGTQILNRSGAVFTSQPAFGGSINVASFLNEGTLRKQGDGQLILTTTTDSGFENQGEIELLQGALELRGRGSSQKSIVVPVDTTFTLRGDFAFAPSTSLSGQGRIEFRGGVQDFTDAQLLPLGVITFVGSTTTIGNTLPDAAQIEQIRARVTFNADQVLNSVDGDFGVISGSGNLTFTGTSRLNQSRISSTGQVTVAPGALLNVFSLGATITAPLENRGTLREFNGLNVSELVNQDGGVVVGTRRIVGDVVNSGVLRVGSVGAPLSSLTIQGNYSQLPAGSLELQLGGTVAGSEHDRLQVTGVAVLQGELDVALFNDFVPNQTDQFTIVTFASSDGVLSTLDLPDVSPLGFVVTKNDRSLDLSLEVVVGGDGPTFTGTAAPNAIVTISANEASLGTTTADDTGAWSFTTPEALTEDRYEITAAGNGPARIDLASPLSAANATAVDLKGLQLLDDTVEYFPFGNDLDGLLEPLDVVLASTQSRMGLPLLGTGTTVGEAFRLNDGRFLLDQETPEDEAPDYAMVFAGLGEDFALSGILPFGIRRLELRNIDVSQGFSADFVVTGSFEPIEIDNKVPFPERIARERIFKALDGCVPEDCEEPVQILVVALKEAEEDVNEIKEEEGDEAIVPDVTTVADLERAERAILHSHGIEEIVNERPELAQLLLDRDDPENIILANLFEQRDNAINLVLEKAVAHANSVVDPSAEDFKFVIGTINLARQAQVLTLNVDPGAIVAELEPAIQKEIKRFQVDACSLDEIKVALDHAGSLELATDAVPASITVEAMKGFVDAFLVRVGEGDNERTKLANTAVRLARDLAATPSLEVGQAYTPEGVIARLRAVIGQGYEFDPSNLLPEKKPSPEPAEDEAKVAILIGDLPINSEGRLTTESVTALLNGSPTISSLVDEVPSGVTRIAPTEELEFSIAIDNGEITPLNIPTLTFAFDENPIGKGFESAGFISLGSYGENGEFTRATFAGGFDLIGEVDGFDTSLGVVLDGSGEDRGFFPDEDGRGGEIIAQAAVEFGLKTPTDTPGFHLSVEGGAATFDMLVRVDDGLGFSFEQFDLNNIVVERFEAAIGGTPPGERADSPIPDDALLKLTSTDVEVNVADPAKPLLDFGSLSVELPTAPGDLKTLIADVDEFVVDVDGAYNLRPVFGEGFGFTFRGIGQRLANLGVPDVIQVDALGFQAKPTFFDDTGQINQPSDFLLTLSAGLHLPEPLSISATINELTIDYGAITRGEGVLAAMSFDGAAGQIGPWTLGPLGSFQGSFAFESFDYDAPGGGTESAILARIQGGLSFNVGGDVEGEGAGFTVDGAFTLNPLSFVGLGLDVRGELPLGATGFSIKGGGGRVVANPPPIRDINVPLDMFAESDAPGVLDFKDLAGPLDFEQLKIAAKNQLEGPSVPFWDAPWMFAVDVDLGIQGDANDTFVLDTTIGARIDPGAANTKIFGLGALNVKAPAQPEVQLGEAGVLLDLQSGDFRSLSLAFRTGGKDEGLDIPAEVLLGGQVTKQGDLFEIAVQGEVKIDGISEKDPEGRPLGFEAGGLFVLDPDSGMYGAVQFNMDVNKPDDPLFLEADVFLRFNPYNVEHELDPVRAAELVPQLVREGRAPIPPGFGLLGEVQLTLKDILNVAGSIEIDAAPGRFTAELDVAGKVLGDVVNIAYRGKLEVADDANGKSELQRLDVEAVFEVVFAPGFLEARADGRLLITTAGLEDLSGSAEGFLFGLPFEAKARIDRHGCLTLGAAEGDTEIPLPGGGVCGVREREPARMTVVDATFLERDTSVTVASEVQFSGNRQFLVPPGSDPAISLEYWTMSRPEDTAVGFADAGDFRRIDRGKVTVPVEFLADLNEGLRLFELPERVELPLEIFGDRSLEADETFTVFAQPVIPDRFPLAIVREDSFARITLTNDDREAEPPSDSVVFFDFDRLEQLPGPDGSLIPQFAFEAGPDRSRPELTFDLASVTALTHSTQKVTSPRRNGLTREEGVSQAAFADEWVSLESTDRVDPDPISEVGGRETPQQLSSSTLVERREYFEFTITTPLFTEPDGTKVGLRVDGIDFFDRADRGGTQWEVRYSLDGFANVLASGATHGTTFGRNRTNFRYPTGQASELPGNTKITFRIYGPQGVSALRAESLPWHIDNLSLVGGVYRVPRTVLTRPQPPLVKGTTTDRTLLRRAPTGTVTATRTTTTTTTTVRTGLTPKSRAANGFASGSTVFFDANRNGVADFVDLNDNGQQDGDEMLEPTAQADAGGLFELSIPLAFDVNGDQLIGVEDGWMVAQGGIDLGTSLSMPLRLRAPAGAPSVTPLTTLITHLVDEAGLTLDAAHDAVRDGLSVNDVSLPFALDLFAADHLEDVLTGLEGADRTYKGLMQLQNTTLLFSELLAAPGGDIGAMGDYAFAAMARELQASGELDFTDVATLRRVLADASQAALVSLSSEAMQATAEVATRASVVLQDLVVSDPLAKLQLWKQLQRYVATTVLSDVQKVGQGSLTPADFVSRYSLVQLLISSGETEAGTIFPVGISIEDVALPEPSEGAVVFPFPVTLSAPSDLPVEVDYVTQPSTASAVWADYEAVSGTLTFAPGEQRKVIEVTVFADDLDEVGEVFHVQLSRPQHGLLEEVRAVGTILMGAEATLPDSFNLGATLVVGVGQQVELRAVLPQIISGRVNWDDGTESTATLSPTGELVAVQATHRYEMAGEYFVTVEFEQADGSTVLGKRAVDVVFGGDANRDGTVDFADFLQLSGNFGRTDAVWEDGDFDENGVIEFSDFLVLSTNFNKSLSG